MNNKRKMKKKVKGIGNILNKIVAENLPKLKKEIPIQV
jgi:hypothetical protein